VPQTKRCTRPKIVSWYAHMTNEQLEECLMRGYGYVKGSELRGEFIIENHQVVSNTLHTIEIWERDRTEQPSNPMNDGNYDVCTECNGDGGFEDTYIGPDHEVCSDWYECRACEGEGYVFHD
jgi:hypothetical protein